MRRLVTLLGCMLALMIGLIPLGQTWGASSVSIPLWNFVGTWTGTANAVSEGGGYFTNVAVTVTVADQQTDTTGATYFRGTIAFASPLGTGNPASIVATADIKGTMKQMQNVMLMWSGDGFVGCGMGTSMAMPNTASTVGGTNGMLMIHGCLHFPGPAAAGPLAIGTPAMVIVDLTKQ